MAKFPVFCAECAVERGFSHGYYLADLRDDFCFELRCRYGHDVKCFLGNQGHEILFQASVYSILDGCYRDAILFLFSCVDSFYEYALRVIFSDRGLDDDIFKACWEDVSQQSERRRGAFVFLWVRTFGGCPELLSDKWVSLRNTVAHGGKIPTRQEAVDFGNAVFDMLRPQIAALLSRFPDAWRTQDERVGRERRMKLGDGSGISRLFCSMILSEFVGFGRGNLNYIEYCLDFYSESGKFADLRKDPSRFIR
ncbi:hypothetical protein IHV25_09700 [Phaeovibrio sulfidiphilus]|uniref:Apea-like HEPN domain-containing protein n=1 Tax=Phaeovibrio sulfidiphilus TaxID=1220600 RepID=A0A8J6YNL1_9PROT|nr:hypothetical protein [Phaeovibrio sulfidiphilus]MBE1237915.1 hypothetical protein [Phaeovibrio sulfidiphilus]